MNNLKDTVLSKLRAIFGTYRDMWATMPGMMAIIHGALLLVLFFGYLFHQTDSKNEKKAEEANANVIKTETNANVQSNQTEILKQNDQKIAKDTKEVEKREKDARANYNSAVRRDSNSYGADAREANRRFCERFPDDSSCKPTSR